MTRASDVPIFEVRATLTNGARPKLGRYATQADAAEWARWLVTTGDVTRVDIVLRVQGHIQLVAAIGPTSASASVGRPIASRGALVLEPMALDC
jgi:hypothetical protein